MSGDLPKGAYLATHYLDRRSGTETRRIYYDDGRVEAFDGRAWWLVCEFTPEQVGRAHDAIRASGLPNAADLVDRTVRDPARLSYAWRLDEGSGAVTNWAYPAREHPAFTALDERLNVLEDEAGAEDSQLVD